MAQLGERPRDRELLRRVVSGFGAPEKMARARWVVAEAEVALATRDLRGSPRTPADASATSSRYPLDTTRAATASSAFCRRPASRPDR